MEHFFMFQNCKKNLAKKERYFVVYVPVLVLIPSALFFASFLKLVVN